MNLAQNIPAFDLSSRFIQLLANHPWFNITWLAASDRSAGKTYAEACKWKLDTPLPAHIAQMTIQPNTPEGAVDLPRIIFSSVDAPIARELEPLFAAAGCAVISRSPSKWPGLCGLLAGFLRGRLHSPR